MQFFQPQSKVQKDRAIMRETDERMAKYSRRGLIVNILAYLLCFTLGYMTVIAPTLSVVLTVGLIVITVIRGYFLIRFDTIYSCAPTKWRNIYFISTLIGTVWWSAILVSFTLVLGMVGETPVLWIYTVISLSTTIHATAPYRTFSRIFQLIALLPVALSGFYIGGFEGYMYGFMMLVFLAMQEYQVGNLSELHWQRLESNHALKQKAQNLEAEKRDTEASFDISTEFLESLGHEFRTSLNDIMGGLSLLTESNRGRQQSELLSMAAKACERQLDLVNNVADFSRINSRQLVLDHSVINLRVQLESMISSAGVEAAQQGVELDYRIAADLPLRIAVDAKRLTQIIKNLLTNTVQFSEQGHVHIDVQLERLADQRGQLDVMISDHLTHAEDVNLDASEKSSAAHATGLWLSICRGLAECMSGAIEVYNEPGKDSCYRLTLPVDIASNQPAIFKSHPKLQGKQVALVDSGKLLDQGHVEELEAWGLLVECLHNRELVAEKIDKLSHGETQLTALIWVASSAENVALKQLADDYPHLPILLVSSPEGQALTGPQFYALERPLMRKPLHELLCHTILNKPLEATQSLAPSASRLSNMQVLLVEDHRVNQMVAEAMLKKLGYQVHLAVNGLEALQINEQADIDLILMDCQMPEMDGYEATRRIRAQEKTVDNGTRVPILAMTAHTTEEDKSLCFSSGMDDYLAKPVRCDDLESHLLRWLGKDTDETPKDSLEARA